MLHYFKDPIRTKLCPMAVVMEVTRCWAKNVLRYELAQILPEKKGGLLNIC